MYRVIGNLTNVRNCGSLQQRSVRVKKAKHGSDSKQTNWGELLARFANELHCVLRPKVVFLNIYCKQVMYI